ncbi:MAG: 6-pyruvoyl tetrahydropterin synthase family protein [Nanopusillaceae archaeon]
MEERLIKVGKKFKFAAAHRLINHSGKCKNLHGHEWYVNVYLSVPEKIRLQNYHKISFDFNDFSVLKDWIDANLDHALLIAEYDKELLKVAKKLKTKYFVLPDTSAEEIAIFLKKKFQDILNKKFSFAPETILVFLIEVFESPNNICIL